MASSILVIHTDDLERRRLSRVLEKAGFRVIAVASGVQGLFQVLESAPILILLAEEVPPLEAGDLLTVLRRLTDAPVLILGKGGDPEEVTALEDGADFYARLPFDPEVLLARVRVLLRRYRRSTGTRGADEPVRIDANLTHTERRLLVCLAAHDGRPVAAEQLIVEVWGGKVSASAVKFYISRLRYKLNTGGNGLSLPSVRGVGYRLMRIASQKVARLGQAV